MKKLLIASLLLSSLFYASAYNEDGLRWGVGARAGVAAFTGQLNTVSTTRVAGAPVTTTGVEHDGTFTAGITSFQGGVFAEAAYRWCDWSAGILVDVNGDTLKKDFAFIEDTNFGTPLAATSTRFARLQSPIHIGADLRGGMYFGDALWYALIGGEAIRYEFTHSINIQQAPFSAAAPAILGTTPDKFWRGAVRVGTGIECYLTDCVALKLEYRFIWAGKRTQPFISQNFTDAEDVTETVTLADVLHFRQHVTALMVSYVF